MERVKVIFFMEPTDPDDKTGLTEEDFNSVHDTIAGVIGGDEIEIVRVSE